MEEKLADCVLIYREGREFFSTIGVLSIHSPVLRDMFAECVCDSPNERPQVILEDSASDLEYLLEEVHGPGSFIFDMCLPEAYTAFSTVSRWKASTIMAFKYHMEGEIPLRLAYIVWCIYLILVVQDLFNIPEGVMNHG
jgi:hypothetical protein